MKAMENALKAKNPGTIHLRLTRAYYSLLQYVPVAERQEAINIAVLLEVPHRQFKGTKYLRYMHGRVHDFFPAITADLSYEFAQQVKKSFSARAMQDPEVEVSLVNEPLALQDLRNKLAHTMYSYWALTEPRLLHLTPEQQPSTILDQLYDSLVAVPDAGGKSEVRNKDYVRNWSVHQFKRHEIEIELGPKPVAGKRFQDNRFDSIYTGDFHAYFQFLSFDTLEETGSIEQTKAFINAAEDARAGRRPAEFAAIVQPPRENIVAKHNAYQMASRYLFDADIVRIPVDEGEFSRLANGIRGGPEEFRLLHAN